MVIPPTPNLDMGEKSLTMAVWVSTSQSYSNEELLIEHGVWGSDSGVYQLTTPGSDTVRFNFLAMNDSQGPLDATDNLADGKWHFIVATLDQWTGLASIYDNGVLLNSMTVQESIGSDEVPTATYVGYRGNGSCYFQGGIGEVLFYDQR